MQRFRITAAFEIPGPPPDKLMQTALNLVNQALAQVGASEVKFSFENAECMRHNDDLRLQQASAWNRQRAEIGTTACDLPMPTSCKACRESGLERVCKTPQAACPLFTEKAG